MFQSMVLPRGMNEWEILWLAADAPLKDCTTLVDFEETVEMFDDLGMPPNHRSLVAGLLLFVKKYCCHCYCYCHCDCYCHCHCHCYCCCGCGYEYCCYGCCYWLTHFFKPCRLLLFLLQRSLQRQYCWLPKTSKNDVYCSAKIKESNGSMANNASSS